MKKKYLVILLLTMFLMPFKVFATGSFGLSTSSITMYPGESKTITISTTDSVGRLNIASSNGGVASVSLGSIFIDSVGASKTFTITANSIGSSKVSVVGSENYASFSDETSLKGLTKTITVNVIAKPESKPNSTPTTPSTNNNTTTNNKNNSNNNLSKNNNIKTLRDFSKIKVILF